MTELSTDDVYDDALAVPEAEPQSLSAPSVATDLFTVVRPESPETSEVRALRNALTLRWGNDAKTRALAVVGPDRGDGRSVLAANLAVAFSQIGMRTLLVDADMRHARLHALFGMGNRFGLSNFLAGSGNPGVQPVLNLEHLSIVCAGSVPFSPRDILHRGALQSFFDAVGEAFDLIIVDTPAANTAADFQLIASICKTAIVIGRERRTRMHDLAGLLTTLQTLEIPVLGGVMTRETNV